MRSAAPMLELRAGGYVCGVCQQERANTFSAPRPRLVPYRQCLGSHPSATLPFALCLLHGFFRSLASPTNRGSGIRGPPHSGVQPRSKNGTLTIACWRTQRRLSERSSWHLEISPATTLGGNSCAVEPQREQTTKRRKRLNQGTISFTNCKLP
jgi:hypothetical protein